MHPDLSSHLHTPECNRLIEALLQCHQENKFKKFIGACNDANRAMLKCLKAEIAVKLTEKSLWPFKKRLEDKKQPNKQPTPVKTKTHLLHLGSSFHTLLKMESFLDIEEDYLSQGKSYETLTERAFSSLYFMERDGGHYRLLVHSNKICLITLSPKHPIITQNLEIASISYQANENCNRLNNKVTGKKKSGAQYLSDCSILCTITCKDRKDPFVVRSNLVAKLIEMNEDIAKDPNLLKNCDKGYIAIVFPKLSNYERELSRWMSEEDYNKKVGTNAHTELKK